MNAKKKLFIKIIEGLQVTSQFVVTATEATENNQLKDGYIEYGNDYDKTYYRFDEEFLNENRADFEALINYENAANIQRINNWVVFFGILTMLGIASGIIYAIYLFALVK